MTNLIAFAPDKPVTRFHPDRTCMSLVVNRLCGGAIENIEKADITNLSDQGAVWQQLYEGKTIGDGKGAYWVHQDPAEAVEALVTEGLLPESWTNRSLRSFDASRAEARVRFLQENRLTGKATVAITIGNHAEVAEMGLYTIAMAPLPGSVMQFSLWWRQRNWPCPPTMFDLVNLAGLGRSTIEAVEELAISGCLALGSYGCPMPSRINWSVASREPREEVIWAAHHGEVIACRDGLGPSPSFGTTEAVHRIWSMGMAVTDITPEAITITVPPIWETHKSQTSR